MSYSTKAIANLFLEKGLNDGRPIDPMKMQKLVYLAHGYHLGLTGKPLINQNFQAWQHGPVVPELYHEFKQFRYSPINEFATEGNGKPVPPPKDDPAVERVSDFVWKTYGNRASTVLSELSHSKGGPWDQVFNKKTTFGSRTISDNIIEDFFKKHVKRS